MIFPLPGLVDSREASPGRRDRRFLACSQEEFSPVFLGILVFDSNSNGNKNGVVIVTVLVVITIVISTIMVLVVGMVVVYIYIATRN